jgi:hypothetical protein
VRERVRRRGAVQKRLVRCAPYLRGCTSALRGGAEGAGPRACSIVVTFMRLGVIHRERTGRADDRKVEVESGGAQAARVCVRERVARRVRERGEVRRGGNDEVSERKDCTR